MTGRWIPHWPIVRNTVALLAIAGAALVLLSVFPPISQQVNGSALAATRIDPSPDSSVELRNLPTASTEPIIRHEQHLVTAIIDDLVVFTAAQFPEITDPSSLLSGGVIAVDSAVHSGAAGCVNNPALLVGNAFYCAAGDEIVYDQATLIPVIVENYGAPGLIATFAHEFGHVIQAHTSPTPADRLNSPELYPSLFIEAQSDCYAGAFLAWVVDGNATGLHLHPDSVGLALGPMMDFADPLTLAPTDATAHGMAIDRLTWVTIGYRQGAASCAAMTFSTMPHVRGTLPESAQHLPEGGARFSSTTALATRAQSLVAQFAPDDSAASVEPLPRLGAVARYGQFAQASIIALDAGLRWAYLDESKIAAIHNNADSFVTVPPQASCFVGAWAADTIAQAEPGELGAWPGDADEALAAIRELTDADFGNLVAYAQGFRLGLSYC